MSRKAIHLLTTEVLQSASSKYGLDPARLVDLGSGNVNTVYDCQADGQSCILRLTHNSRREQRELASEADYVNYLAQNGAAVSRVIPSKDGNLAEALPNGFSAVLFEKAPGQLPDEADWNDDFYYRWGKLTGALHRISRSYTPPSGLKRHAWHEDGWFQFRSYIPADQTTVLQQADELLAELNSLPRDAAGYGLIHNDLHSRNFLQHGEQLTAFDFDDCCYNWYVNDIAVILYHALTRFSRPPRSGAEEKAFGERFMQQFLTGYRTEHELDAAWVARLPLFLKMRRMLLYVFYHQEFDLDNLSALMSGRIADTRQAIEQDTPLTDIRFASL
ncbi:Ser/Thr protein kinase RdoA (MazF antagonist) [Tumebacillus sp. BK434]|uniref:phosphotransferase enzyme family protein n=1 Tax=Tumebacillus sp. BK434 TaxID=2512169 RepID=UPI00104E03D5|nr:phosphotransferase [Tumebacillus sp. BK434]TCP59214.1 Ser/Thr protein kinase RdoA (MazF antagonist) [Tumebacillus sp. BK434]